MISRTRSIVMMSALLGTACGGGPTGTNPPTPTPAATTAPTARPSPTPNAFAAGCGNPLPDLADMYGFAVKVQLEPSPRKKILNASPLVRNGAYCSQVGLAGAFCETRIETDPGRVSCDHYLSGLADDNGPGPIWYQQVGDHLLRCPGVNSSGEAPGCQLKPENQYLLDVYQPGIYVACGGKGSNGSCGLCTLSAASYETPPESIGTRRPGLCSGT
jgi:hypothetical protein